MPESPQLLVYLSDFVAAFTRHGGSEFESSLKTSSEEEFLFSVIRLSIVYREYGDNKKSLWLLQWLIDRGVNHPLVLDNKVRTLIDSNCFVEASCALSRLAILDQGEIFQGASQCLLPHQQSLLSALRSHASGFFVADMEDDLWPQPLAEDFLLKILIAANAAQKFGDPFLALAMIQELMQWGYWCFDALSVQARDVWSVLVVQLGRDVLNDLSLYRQAASYLENSKEVGLAWLSMLIRVETFTDRGQSLEAEQLVLGFISSHPDHAAARAWLADQQDVPKRRGICEPLASEVRLVDQALLRDSKILDYFLKRTV